METKICANPNCKKEKKISEFVKDKRNKDGLTSRCKDCRNEHYNNYYKQNPEKQKEKNDSQKENRQLYYNSEDGIISSRKTHLKRMYNISLEDYNEISIKQDHKCAICGGYETYYRNKVLCVDHSHDTGEIRGLLCNTCNRALGLFKENFEILQNAINYLIKTNKN